MEEIIVDLENVLQRRLEVSLDIPRGCSISLEARNGRNYGLGLIPIIYAHTLLDGARNALKSQSIDTSKVLWEVALDAMRNSGFSDNEIELYLFFNHLFPLGDGAWVNGFEAVLAYCTSESKGIPIPVLQLRQLNQDGSDTIFSQMPVLSTGEEHSGFGMLQGYAGAKELIKNQGFVLIDGEEFGRWKVRARVDGEEFITFSFSS
jgi:hypothetical protein